MTLEEFEDDALAFIADEMKAEGKRLLNMAEQAQFELTRRLLERGATHLETDHYKGVMEPGPITHEITHEKMVELQAYIPAEVYQNTYYEKPVWDQRQLNELRKLGGDVARIIDEARVSRRGDPRLKLTKKMEVKE